MADNGDRDEIFKRFAQISSFFSLSIIVSGLVFPHVLLTFKRPFSYAIFWTSVADFLGSIGGTFGYASPGDGKCVLQSILRLYFYPASWIWILILVYQLRNLLIFKELGLKPREMHLIAWLVPLIPLLLPFSSGNMSYGTDDRVSGQYPCSWSSNHEASKYVWIIAVYWGLVLFCFSIMLFWIYSVYNYFQVEKVPVNSIEYSLWRTMILYPLSMFITWVPLVLFAIIQVGTIWFTDYPMALQQVVLILSTQNGTLLSIIFFCRSKRIRVHWKQLIYRKIFCFDETKIRNLSNTRDRRLSADLVVSPDIVLDNSDVESIPDDPNDFNASILAGDWDSDEELLLDTIYDRQTNQTADPHRSSRSHHNKELVLQAKRASHRSRHSMQANVEDNPLHGSTSVRLSSSRGRGIMETDDGYGIEL